MKKHNLGIIANAVSDEGKDIYLTKFINILKPLTDEIFVIDGDFPESSDKKIHIIKIKADLEKESMLIRSIKFILVQLRFSFNLMKITKKIDVVIFFGATMILPMLYAKMMKRMMIIIAGGSASKSAEKHYRGRLLGISGFVFPLILRTLERISFSLSDRIGVESESAIAFLGLERYRDKIRIISNMYLDLDRYNIKKVLEERGKLIGFISRLSEGKGVMNFVAAIPLLLREHNDLKFLIGGDGPLFDEIKKELNSKGLYGIVKLTGWIAHDELPDILNELKLLVFPSYSEGVPNIVSEAMACGVPVLATPVGGVPDLIKDEDTGFILENNSPECIVETILRASNYPDLDRIIDNARKFIEEEYTYDVAVERYRKILEKIR